MSRRRVTWKQLSTEFVVGCFFFGALAILAFFTIIISRDRLFSDGHRYEIRFPTIAALSEGDRVLVRGVAVGTVKAIDLQPETVRVQALLDEEIELYRDYSIEVRYSSVLGGRHLAIDVGSADAGPLPPETLLHGEAPPDIVSETARLVSDMKDELGRITAKLEEEQLIDRLGSLLENADAVAAGLRKGEGTLGRLLKDEALYEETLQTAGTVRDAGADVQKAAVAFRRTVEDARAGKGTVGKLLTDDRLYDDVRAVVADVKSGKGTLGRLVEDDTVYRNLEEISRQLADVTGRLATGESTLGRLLTDDGRLYEDARETAAAARDIAENVRSGRGTLGRLVQDPALYDDAKDTVQEVRQAVRDFREQAPVSTFGSLMFGAL